MESNQVDISSIKVSYNNDNEIAIVDPIDTSPEFKKLVWYPYMKDLFGALLERTTDQSEKGISKPALHSFMNLPGLIGDSFFRVLDANKDQFLDQTEYTNGLSRIYFGDFDEKLKFVFEMYDFDGNGLITKEDIRTMLSYVPLTTISDNEGLKEGFFTRNGGG